MAFDFKKEYKEFYMPKNKPEIVIVPKANYIAVKGKGDPNEEGGAWVQFTSRWGQRLGQEKVASEISNLCKQKDPKPYGFGSFWHAVRDSNPRPSGP